MPGLAWWSGGQAAIPSAALLTLCSMRMDVFHSYPATTLNHRSSSAKEGSHSTTKHQKYFCTTREEAKLKQLLSSPLLLPDSGNRRAVSGEAGLMLATYKL